MRHSKALVVGYWIGTALFCLQMAFTAYGQLRMPQVAAAFTHLGFPAYFRVDLGWAKLLGLALLVTPVPARLKEWIYAGFAFELGAAIVAHLSVGDGVAAWGWAAATGVLWALSYLCWRRLQAAAAGGRALQPARSRPNSMPAFSRPSQTTTAAPTQTAIEVTSSAVV